MASWRSVDTVAEIIPALRELAAPTADAVVQKA
jgi:hypothetical protein